MLPNLFNTTGDYQYNWRKVTYLGKNDKWYRFQIENGAKLLIDINNINLIFKKR